MSKPLPMPSYVPHIPAQIRAVRSTIGPKELEAMNCHVCNKHYDDLNAHYAILSKMEGDFEGSPIYSEARRVLFCVDCFEHAADDQCMNFFKDKNLFDLCLNQSCKYCNTTVFNKELIKYYCIVYTKDKSRPRNVVQCDIHEECYIENINI